jgi:DNA-binding NtrC family response regulator
VRELRNVLFVAASRCSGAAIDTDLVATVLDEHLKNRQREASGASAAVGQPVSEVETEASDAAGTGLPAATLKDVEARHIAELLQKHRNSRKQVAAALGVSERTLYRKLKRYALN